MKPAVAAAALAVLAVVYALLTYTTARLIVLRGELARQLTQRERIYFVGPV